MADFLHYFCIEFQNNFNMTRRVQSISTGRPQKGHTNIDEKQNEGNG